MQLKQGNIIVQLAQAQIMHDALREAVELREKMRRNLHYHVRVSDIVGRVLKNRGEA